MSRVGFLLALKNCVLESLQLGVRTFPRDWFQLCLIPKMGIPSLRDTTTTPIVNIQPTPV